VRRNIISVGFASKYNLSELIGRTEDEIVAYLKEKGEPSRSYSMLKVFLNLKPGDLIAIKQSGSPVRKKPRLIISGYAIVSGEEEPIYRYDPKGLGHTMQVEYLETDIRNEFTCGYGRTIHKLDNKTHIKSIFGGYYKVSGNQLGQLRKGVSKKNLEPHVRSVNKTYMVSMLHNEIQQSLYKKLKNDFGKNKVFMEKNFVDITVLNGDMAILYEVKPYGAVKQCIREALGQLLEYSWKQRELAGNVKLVIVGPSKPNKLDKNYIKYLKDDIGISFDYMQHSIK